MIRLPLLGCLRIQKLEAADFIPLGIKLTEKERTYTVDSVDYSTGRVSLRDDTFAGGTGFPIFRSEPIAFVREWVKDTQEQELLAPVMEESAPIFVPVTAAPAPEQVKAENFHITDPDLGAGGPKAKYQANVTAIRLLKQLETENRTATAGEQDTLSRYVGWGGIPQAFDSTNERWSAEYGPAPCPCCGMCGMGAATDPDDEHFPHGILLCLDDAA